MNALPRPNSEFLATPSVVCKPRTRSKHPKVALFEPAPKGPWAKKQAAAHGGGLFRAQKRCYAL